MAQSLRLAVLVDVFPGSSDGVLGVLDAVTVLALPPPSLQPKAGAELFLRVIAHTH